MACFQAIYTAKYTIDTYVHISKMSIDFNLYPRETEQSSAHKNTQDLLSFIK